MKLGEFEINKIYNIDCHIGMKQLPNDSIDLVVTSPPYDDLRIYNGYKFDFENIAIELLRVIKKGGVVVWVIGDKIKNGNKSLTSFKQALFFQEIGFNVHDVMIYKKKDEDKIVMGFPAVYNWMSSAKVEDKEASAVLMKAQKDFEAIFKDITE